MGGVAGDGGVLSAILWRKNRELWRWARMSPVLSLISSSFQVRKIHSEKACTYLVRTTCLLLEYRGEGSKILGEYRGEGSKIRAFKSG